MMNKSAKSQKPRAKAVEILLTCEKETQLGEKEVPFESRSFHAPH